MPAEVVFLVEPLFFVAVPPATDVRVLVRRVVVARGVAAFLPLLTDTDSAMTSASVSAAGTTVAAAFFLVVERRLVVAAPTTAGSSAVAVVAALFFVERAAFFSP